MTSNNRNINLLNTVTNNQPLNNKSHFKFDFENQQKNKDFSYSTPNSNFKQQVINRQTTLNKEDAPKEFFRQGFVKPKITWKTRYIEDFYFNKEEEENIIKEHLFHVSNKKSFDFEKLLQTKINVYCNNNIVNVNECSNFDELVCDPILLKNIKDMQFNSMTPIQKTVIPLISSKSDIMACAQTGSGKTIAFLFPIINRLLIEGPPSIDTRRFVSYPVVLILAPVRELAEQIYNVAKILVRNSYIRVSKLYGGVPHDNQNKELKSGVDIIISTPGRLIDFLQRGRISLSCIRFLVLDEADRMLDMGFEKQLNEIVNQFGRLIYILNII
jgi:hypothetical protein